MHFNWLTPVLPSVRTGYTSEKYPGKYTENLREKWYKRLDAAYHGHTHSEKLYTKQYQTRNLKSKHTDLLLRVHTNTSFIRYTADFLSTLTHQPVLTKKLSDVSCQDMQNFIYLLTHITFFRVFNNGLIQHENSLDLLQ